MILIVSKHLYVDQKCFTDKNNKRTELILTLNFIVFRYSPVHKKLKIISLCLENILVSNVPKAKDKELLYFCRLTH